MLQGHLRHGDGAPVMGDHAAHEIDVDITGVADRHVAVHLRVGLPEGTGGGVSTSLLDEDVVP